MTANKPTNAKKAMGRPTIYTDELATEICERVALGRSIRSVCLDKDMPSMSTVMMSLDKNSDFSEQYRRACEERETTHFEEMLTIADEVLPETAEVARAKLRIDTRKWVLARMNHSKKPTQTYPKANLVFSSHFTVCCLCDFTRDLHKLHRHFKLGIELIRQWLMFKIR